MIWKKSVFNKLTTKYIVTFDGLRILYEIDYRGNAMCIDYLTNIILSFIFSFMKLFHCDVHLICSKKKLQ